MSPSRRRFCTALLAGAAAATLPVPALAGKGIRRRQVGALALTAISDGHFDLRLGAFPNTDALGIGGPRYPVRVGANLWQIRSGARVFMVDTGSGDTLKAAYPATGQLVTCMSDLADPAQVTDIVLTHLHADHIGGLMDGDAMRWPNATLHICETELKFWADPATAASLPAHQQPLAGLIASLMEKLPYPLQVHSAAASADLGGGISLHPLPGHTPGHMGVRLSSGGEQAILLADAFICAPLQLRHPHVSYALDVDADGAVATRLRLLDMLASDGIPFAATHMNTLAFGRVERRGDGYAFNPA